jgi:hypothetical protein
LHRRDEEIQRMHRVASGTERRLVVCRQREWDQAVDSIQVACRSAGAALYQMEDAKTHR